VGRELSEYGYVVKKSKYPRVYELEKVIMHNEKSIVTYELIFRCWGYR